MSLNQTATTIEQLAPIATNIANDFATMNQTVSSKRDAEAELLGRAIEVVKPALRALTRPLTGRIISTFCGTEGPNPLSKHKYFRVRGILLADCFDEKDTGRHSGVYCGSRLYLLADGQLAIIRRSGTWNAWQGSWNRYEATMEIVSPRKALDSFKFSTILRRLENTCKEQARKNNTKAANKRVAYLATLAPLAQ